MQSGWSLAELLIVCGVVAVLAMFAIPIQRSLVSNNHALVEINRIKSSMKLARRAAITHQQHVIFCASKSKHRCDGNWSNGQIMFIDKNNNAQFDDLDVLLRVLEPVKDGASLTWRGFYRNQFALKFNPSGRNKAGNGTFTYQPDVNEAEVHKLVVNRGGRIRHEVLR